MSDDSDQNRTWWEDALGITVSPEQRARDRAAIEAMRSVFSPTVRSVSPTEYLASIVSILEPTPPGKP